MTLAFRTAFYIFKILVMPIFFWIWTALPSSAQDHKLDTFSVQSASDTLVLKKLVNQPLAKSILWEISGNGLSQPSYLFGTIHMICATDYMWHDYMQEAFDKSDEVILEIDMEEIEQKFGNIFGTLPDSNQYVGGYQDKNLVEDWNKLQNDSMTREIVEELIAIFQEDSTIDFNINSLISYVENEMGDIETATILDSPSISAPILSEQSYVHKDRDSNRDGRLVDDNGIYIYSKHIVQAKEFDISSIESKHDAEEVTYNEPDGTTYAGYGMIEDCDRMVSYEGRLAIMARKNNKQITGLETVDDQLAFMWSSVDNYERKRKNDFPELDIDQPLNYLSKIYLSQDINLMLDLMSVPEMGLDNLDTYLFDRNESWIEILKNKIKSGTKFIAVGAGHLPGDRGLIQLLIKAGYKLKPILK